MRNYLGGCRIPCFYVYALQMCDANGCLDCRGGVQRIDLGNCATCLLLNTWLLTSVSTLGHVISRTKTCEGWINVGCTSKKLTHWTATKMRWTQRCSAPPPFSFVMIKENLPWIVTEQILSLGNLSFLFLIIITSLILFSTIFVNELIRSTHHQGDFISCREVKGTFHENLWPKLVLWPLSWRMGYQQGQGYVKLKNIHSNKKLNFFKKKFPFQPFYK